MDSNEHRGYEGYDCYSTGSSTPASVGPYTFSGSWGAAKPGVGGGAVGGAPGNGGKHSESPDSIIAKINQRLDLLSRDNGGKESQESSFSFEAFQSYMAADTEPYRYSEEATGTGERTGEPPQTPENHTPSRPGKGGGARRGQGGRPGGNKTRGGGKRGGEKGGFSQQDLESLEYNEIRSTTPDQYN